MDIEIRRSMWAFMEEINRAGTTIILTTHYLEEAENLCRSIAIIDDGLIVENSSMQALLHRLHRQAFLLTLSRPVQALPGGAPVRLRIQDEYTLEAVLEQEQTLNSLFDWLNGQGHGCAVHAQQAEPPGAVLPGPGEEEEGRSSMSNWQGYRIAYSTIVIKEVLRFARIWSADHIAFGHYDQPVFPHFRGPHR